MGASEELNGRLSVMSSLLRRRRTGAEAACLVPELVALAVQARHVGFNVGGERADVLRDYAAQLVLEAGDWAERVAAEVIALGVTVDARPVTVAGASVVFPAGRLGAREANAQLVVALDAACATVRRASQHAVDPGEPGEPLLVDLLEWLEAQKWILRTEVSG